MSGRRAHVVVLGSGAAGMAAALAAASDGARVTLLESSPWLGGTTAISGGGIWVPANPWAAAAGVSDSVAAAVTYLGELNLGDTDPALAETYVRNALGVLESIEDRSGLTWQHLVRMPDYHCERPGACEGGRALEIEPHHAAPAMLQLIRPDPYDVPPWSINEEGGAHPRPDDAELARRRREAVTLRGRGLVAALGTAAQRREADIRIACGAGELVTTGRAVVGVRVDGEELRGSVVVATGGFERSPELTAAFLRGPILAPAGPPSNRGDGLRLGMSVGAALANMSEAWWCPAMRLAGETIDGEPFFRMLFLDLAKPGGLLVDRHGRRFVNEATNYNDLGRELHQIDGATFDLPRVPSWFVFDSRRRRDLPIGFVHAPEPDGESVVQADSIAELARLADMPESALEGTVTRFNHDVRTGSDRFGRGSLRWDRFSSGGGPPRAVESPPFHAVRVLPGCLGTKGGLAIDHHAQVLAADGSGPIPGLFAAGNAAASPFGCAYPGPGATIGPALVFGTLAGEAAAAG